MLLVFSPSSYSISFEFSMHRCSPFFKRHPPQGCNLVVVFQRWKIDADPVGEIFFASIFGAWQIAPARVPKQGMPDFLCRAGCTPLRQAVWCSCVISGRRRIRNHLDVSILFSCQACIDRGDLWWWMHPFFSPPCLFSSTNNFTLYTFFRGLGWLLTTKSMPLFLSISFGRTCLGGPHMASFPIPTT